MGTVDRQDDDGAVVESFNVKGGVRGHRGSGHPLTAASSANSAIAAWDTSGLLYSRHCVSFPPLKPKIPMYSFWYLTGLSRPSASLRYRASSTFGSTRS